MRFASGLSSGGLKKCIYVAEQFLKCLRKTEVRLWTGILDCFCVLGSLSTEETALNFPWLRVLWRNKRKLYRKSTDQHCVRTDWLASLPMAFASVSKRVTVHSLSFDWRAWLPWRNVFSRRTQNWRRECGIRKHASVEHDSVINARAHVAVARFFESSFCPAFVFAFLSIFTRGAKVSSAMKL